MNDFRVVTRLALLGTGEVLAVGADNVCGVVSDGSDTAELGDPVARKWRMTARLPSRRQGPVLVALVDGRALVTAGINGENEGAIAKSSTVVFDPATHTWSSSGLLNAARMSPAAAALADGRVLVAGGLFVDKYRVNARALDSAEIWAPQSGRWSRTAPLSAPRLNPAGVALTDGSFLVVGGLRSWGGEVEQTTAETFNPATGRWTPAGELAAPRSGFSLVALPDGGALVVGGMLTRTVTEQGEQFYPREPTATVERFDPLSRTWSTTKGMNGRPGAATAVAMADGRVLAVAAKTAEIYDPVARTWTKTKPLPGGRTDASALLLNDGSVLVGGGWSTAPDPDSTPSCPEPNPQTWRYVPGS